MQGKLLISCIRLLFSPAGVMRIRTSGMRVAVKGELKLLEVGRPQRRIIWRAACLLCDG
jgi:hypothetical protein